MGFLFRLDKEETRSEEDKSIKEIAEVQNKGSVELKDSSLLEFEELSLCLMDVDCKVLLELNKAISIKV